MATITYGEALGNFDYPLDFFDFSNYSLTTATSTNLAAEDASGATIEITGTGLTYLGSEVTGGTINSFVQKDSLGAVLFSVTGASVDAATVAADLIQFQNIFSLFAGDDLVLGSSHRDVVVGGAGHDTLRGGDGGDWLVGMQGRDHMTGEAGRDTFVFGYNFGGRNTGTDYVTDFQDTGAKSDDLIYIRHRHYADLTITQQGNDVVLDFGKADLVIRNATVAQFGLDDFTFIDPTAN